MTRIQSPERICTVSHDEDSRVEDLKVVVLEVVGTVLVGRVSDCGFEGRKLEVSVDIGQAVGGVDRRGVSLLDISRVRRLASTPELPARIVSASIVLRP